MRLKQGKKQRKYRLSGINTNEQWESFCRTVTDLVFIAVPSAVMDFLFRLWALSQRLTCSFLGECQEILFFFATWATYFSLCREKLVLCSFCLDTACFVCFPTKFFPGTATVSVQIFHRTRTKVVCTGRGLMFRHSLCMRTQIADGLNELELRSSNKAHLIINLSS